MQNGSTGACREIEMLIKALAGPSTGLWRAEVLGAVLIYMT